MIITTSRHPGKSLILSAKYLSTMLNLKYVGRDNKDIYKLIAIARRYGYSKLAILSTNISTNEQNKDNKDGKNKFVLNICTFGYGKRGFSWIKRINIAVD